MFKGGTVMKDGFYVRKEMKVTIYEREKCPDDVFVVVVNDTHPDEPIVLTGMLARNLVTRRVDIIDMVDKGKES